MDPKVITCKAAVAWGEGEELKVEEIQVDPPKGCEVRIKMLYASLCHTDTLCHSGFPVALFPRVLGHEGVGVIESVGENVSELRVGDTVMPLYLGECGECLNCKSGKSNLCHNYTLSNTGLMCDGTSRMSIRGKTVYHNITTSTWSEYAVVDVNYVVKVDRRLPLPHASLLCCGFTTGFGATFKTAEVEKGSVVVVLGLGAVGLGAIVGAREQGAAKIIGIDINDFKREKGEAFGMTDFINPSKASDKSISELVKDATGGLGADYVFECTGVTALINEAIESTKIGLGTAVILGLGTQINVEINYGALLFGRTVKGSFYGGVRIRSDLSSVFEKCIDKKIKLDELITHEISLSEMNKAYELTKQADCVKLLIKF
nr:alcohol dehydrogenase class-3-like isoform X2 [Ipomoea batatas]